MLCPTPFLSAGFQDAFPVCRLPAWEGSALGCTKVMDDKFQVQPIPLSPMHFTEMLSLEAPRSHENLFASLLTTSGPVGFSACHFPPAYSLYPCSGARPNLKPSWAWINTTKRWLKQQKLSWWHSSCPSVSVKHICSLVLKIACV